MKTSLPKDNRTFSRYISSNVCHQPAEKTLIDVAPRRMSLAQGLPPGSSSPRVAARGARAASTPGGRHNEAPPHPFCPQIPSGLLRVSRGACSRRAIVAGPMALAVLGFGSGPMGMTGAVYIVPSDHYWEVI